MNRALVFWSGGKDGAYALHLLRDSSDVKIVGLLTTVKRPGMQVSAHGVSEELLLAQARSCGLPVTRVALPDPCPNEAYAAIVGAALEEAREAGVNRAVFGDLHLEDIRAYHESLLANTKVEPMFPLWARDARDLAKEMIAQGLRARIVCVDDHALPPSFAGREFDAELLGALPSEVDPCGENGEFHTFAYAGPMFRIPIAVETGRIRTRDGFSYADLVPGRDRTHGHRANRGSIA